MVIDTSAIMAIALNEPDAADFEARIAEDAIRLISAATVLEATIVLETRLGDAGGRELDFWLFKVGAEIVPVDAEQTDLARRAWRRYGKGRHPAALNYGDCFSYALAVSRGEALLFKGDDFAKTGVNNRRGEEIPE
ncbi:MAG: type II toxin-antitoxin system VapC family toxin [Pseudomonadota bacterium]